MRRFQAAYITRSNIADVSSEQTFNLWIYEFITKEQLNPPVVKK
jgi:hypothetical protein